MRNRSLAYAKINFARLAFRLFVYSVLFNIALTMNWIDPFGSILANIFVGFILWFVPQFLAYLLIRGRGFGMSRGWFVRGVLYAILLTVFLNQVWIDPSGSTTNNLFMGFILYVASYVGSWLFR